MIGSKAEEPTETPNILERIDPTSGLVQASSSSNQLENLKKMLLEKYELSDTEDNKK
jgi:hypothetical protein